MDETLIGRQRWSYLGTFPNPKWAWGLIDLKSRVPILYHCQSKSHEALVALIKKHVDLGAVLYSDSHSSYVTLNQQNRSKLTLYGWYHFWICHMVRYVHEKFGFVHTAVIELTWSNLKKTCLGLSHMEESEGINRYLNTFTFRQIFRKECMHAMIYRCMRVYYQARYSKYLHMVNYEELFQPNILEIERILDELKHLGLT